MTEIEFNMTYYNPRHPWNEEIYSHVIYENLRAAKTSIYAMDK